VSVFSVVIPAYNEENGIAEIVNRVLSIQDELRQCGYDLELLVVDDGSRDKTAEVACKIAETNPGMRVISQKNKGYGGALKTGFSQARGEVIGFLDADGTYPPEYFPNLIHELDRGVDLVIGSRMAGEKSQMPVTRRVGNIFFASLLSLLGWQRITDSASGMRIFRREVLQNIYPLPDGLNLTPVMSTRAIHEQIRMAEVAIPYSERVGRSKLSIFRDGWIFLESIVWTVLAYNPVQVFGIGSLINLGLAAIILLGLVISRLQGITTIGPWGVAALFIAMIAGMVGISFMALGIASNYLVSLFYRRPIRQGFFGTPIFTKPIENYFGWIGAIILVLGHATGAVSLVLGIQGWDISRIWLYLLGSSMAILFGVQMIIYWLLLRVLQELNQREDLVKKDMNSI
jgi:hypothetical protein